MNRASYRLSRIAPHWTILAAMGACGCQGPAPIGVWQQRLTDYIALEGHGDPGILREAPTLRSTRSLRPAEVKFNAKGVPGDGLFAPTRDVQGLLVGLLSQRGRDHFVFLVGVNEQGSNGEWKVIDVRPIAFDVRGNDIHWRIGSERDDLLARYLAAGESPSGGERGSNPRAGPFPRWDDVFRMEPKDGKIMIHDARSKAAWVLSLSGPLDAPR